jgi:hypothetical protein
MFGGRSFNHVLKSRIEAVVAAVFIPRAMRHLLIRPASIFERPAIGFAPTHSRYFIVLAGCYRIRLILCPCKMSAFGYEPYASNGAEIALIENAKILLRFRRHIWHANEAAHKRRPRFLGKRLQ